MARSHGLRGQDQKYLSLLGVEQLERALSIDPHGEVPDQLGFSLYTYEPLPSKKHIRLIEFHVGHLSGRVAFELITVELSNAPAYSTLSYCWGDCKDQVPVFCHGRRMLVSRNLRDGMSRLIGGSTSQLSRGKRYWIDQICINQADLDEKMHQVQLMSRIFSQTRETVIWLGEFTDKVEPRNIEFLGQIDRGRQKEGWELTWEEGCGDYNDVDASITYPEHLVRWGLPDSTSKDWFLLGRFCNLPWFSRIWTIQETILPPVCNVMMLGNQTLSFRWYVQLWEWMDHRLPRSLIRWLSGTGTVGAFLMFHSHRCRFGRNQDQVWQLSTLLQMTDCSESTEPRDQVYALQGCVGSGDAASTYIRENGLLPDYRFPVAHLYRHVTRLCLEESKILRILVRGGVQDECEGTCHGFHGDFPSWVQRFDLPSPSVSSRGELKLKGAIGRARFDFEQARAAVIREDGFSACDHLKLEPRPSKDDLLLSLKGIRVGNIAQCSPTFSYSEDRPFHWWAQGWELALAWAGLDHDCPSDKAADLAQRLFVVLWPTNDMRELRSILGKEADTFWVRLVEAYTQVRQDGDTSLPEEAMKRYEALAEAAKTVLGESAVEVSAQSLLLTYMNGRRLFMTEEGLLGFGTAYMQKGDEVWVLFGGINLHILSTCGDEHHHRGEAFIREFASGEAVREWRAGKREAQWVDIR